MPGKVSLFMPNSPPQPLKPAVPVQWQTHHFKWLLSTTRISDIIPLVSKSICRTPGSLPLLRFGRGRLYSWSVHVSGSVGHFKVWVSVGSWSTTDRRAADFKKIFVLFFWWFSVLLSREDSNNTALKIATLVAQWHCVNAGGGWDTYLISDKLWNAVCCLEWESSLSGRFCSTPHAVGGRSSCTHSSDHSTLKRHKSKQMTSSLIFFEMPEQMTGVKREDLVGVIQHVTPHGDSHNRWTGHDVCVCVFKQKSGPLKQGFQRSRELSCIQNSFSCRKKFLSNAEVWSNQLEEVNGMQGGLKWHNWAEGFTEWKLHADCTATKQHSKPQNKSACTRFVPKLSYLGHLTLIWNERWQWAPSIALKRLF